MFFVSTMMKFPRPSKATSAGMLNCDFSWNAELAEFVPGLSEDAGLLLVDDEDTMKADI